MLDKPTAPDFDEPIDRRNTNCAKWDALSSLYNMDQNDSLAMWVADMEFKPPQSVLDALHGMIDHGVFGYFGDQTAYRAAITGWMERRHGWSVDPDAIFTTYGLGHAIALSIQTWTDPGDSIILFTPVYHVFSKLVRANDRDVVESPLTVDDAGLYRMDLEALEARLTGKEKMIIFCSPHNPGGRVWSAQELLAVGAFARKHDLVLICDEIHHDLVFDGAKHTVMATLDGAPMERLVMLTAASKTFNIAGPHSGNVIIPDAALRETFAKTMLAHSIQPNSVGLVMTQAAYNGGEAWLEAALDYLAQNKRIFDEAINAIPGLSSMPLQGTYLAWVDFSGTGMSAEEFTARVEKDARIATNHGPTFGTGGETRLRFNLACPRAQLHEAVERLQKAFADLQ
ncbi:MAG: MalY/PatB family protein [Pseudomonadota bacterium]